MYFYSKLLQTVNDIDVDDDGKEKYTKIISNSMNHIKNWKFFIVRKVIQDKLRLDTIQNLAGDQSLLIVDGLGLESFASEIQGETNRLVWLKRQKL